MENSERPDRVESRLLEDEMRESFIDYSMSVIVQRALPDVRDGLKPVHRRILYAMHDLGLTPSGGHKKSATVVGEVLGKYHPHGDSAVYDSLVRMAQEFSLRYPMVDGQGNFGSIDGDSAAAYRYTEARLADLATEMLADIDEETVEFRENFDGRLEEPTVLPSRLPNLLVNGSSGIAVGMATNIPPHNLGEVVEACEHLIDHPDCSVSDLTDYVKGPDFPTGGYVHGVDGIREAYETGRGRMVMRARAHIEEREHGGERIVVTEIPFMVNKTRVVEQIADLVRQKKVEQIADLRDESDRDGIRLVIELKRDAIPRIVLNKLYKQTQLQSTFGAIMLALVDGQPKVMSLKEMLSHFLEHRHDVVERRSEYRLSNARDREHVLEGLKTATDHIDDVIEIIRGAEDRGDAGEKLRETYDLSERQSDAILNMRLGRLTGLEIEKLQEELDEVRDTVARLETILASREQRMDIVRGELVELAEEYGDERRTRVVDAPVDLAEEDLIAEEEMVITVSHDGYVKRIAADTYRSQRRGGRGVSGMGTKDEDWVQHVFLASTHDHLLFFTDDGQVYQLKVYEIPQASRTARGKPIVNLLRIDKDETIASTVPVREFDEDRDLVFATRAGTVKRTSLGEYENILSTGIRAISIREGDELIDAQLATGDQSVILATARGMAIRFPLDDVRRQGRPTQGVRGIDLEEDDQVVGMVVVRRKASLLSVTDQGLGKRTAIEDYRPQHRGGKGLINFRLSEKTGRVVAVKEVNDEDELILATRNGVVNRQQAGEIRVIGRNTQGVRLVTLDEGDEVVDVARMLPGEAEEPAEGPEAVEELAEEIAAEEAGDE
ncbi:MAG: DNA gyrase subunit A [Candidatus Palauibacterales bacterium]|nr:DNA gyrase subunit A [Candidatus Palauibacterales bacterium]